MSNGAQLDCVVIGYNELPFDRYETLLRQYGEESEAYRDLKFSFINFGDKKLNYVGLLNHILELAGHGNGTSMRPFESGDIPNLAAVYLANFLRRRGHHTKYINLFQYEKDRLAEFLAEDPYCVAITTTFYVLNFPVTEMVEFIRSHNPKVKIVVGGPLIANHARNYEGGDELKSALDDIGADIYVIEGQGEIALSQIVQCLKENGDLSKVPNIAYAENGALRRTPPVLENSSLDENRIDWLDFNNENLGRTLQTRTARSCAFNCSFCNYPTRAGKLALAGIDTLEEEFDSMYALGNTRNLVFIDDTFNVPLPRFKEICRLLIRKNYNFNWFSYFRCSNSDEEAIDLMAQSGCKGVFLGIESGSPQILKLMTKAATIEKYADGMKLLRERDILTFGSFIVGFPGETDATVKETGDFIKDNKPDYWRAQMWYCEPGTPIEKRRDEFGISGEGFVWQHNTMDSLEAMDHIDRLFLTIKESTWLPQWSFDFWIIPYLNGRGISFQQFKEFMEIAHKMLEMEIAFVPPAQKSKAQQEYLQSLVTMAAGWKNVV
jgi:radical SAM PhpK family P-methyltransferase